MKFLFFVIIAIFFFVNNLYALDNVMQTLEDEINAETEITYGSRDSESEVLQIEGKIIKVGSNFIVLKKDGKEYKLIIDGETTIFINEVKSAIEDINEGDYVFSFYVREEGILKSDHIDILR